MTINLHLYDNLKSLFIASLALCCVIGPNLAQAEGDYYLLTMDNDTLVGEDTGYTVASTSPGSTRRQITRRNPGFSPGQ